MVSKKWQIAAKIWWIKLVHWEYWPRMLVYFLPTLSYIYYSIKARSFFFYSATNPAIFNGGMFGESKFELYLIFPPQVQPKTVLIREGDNMLDVESRISANNLYFPLIVKPDQGGMGWEVEKVENFSELTTYILHHPIDLLIQEFIQWEEEYSVFYYKNPGACQGKITSITHKTPLVLEGNGVQTLEELVIQDKRAVVLFKNFKSRFADKWKAIIPKNEKIIINAIGNHARGSIFYNQTAKTSAAELIKLQDLMDQIVGNMEGIFFGRLDIKTKDFSSLVQGTDFTMIEFNGAGAIPTHIYEPNYSFFKGQAALIKHIKIMYEIAHYLHTRNGTKYVKWHEFWLYFKRSNQYMKKVK